MERHAYRAEVCSASAYFFFLCKEKKLKRVSREVRMVTTGPNATTNGRISEISTNMV